MVNSPRQRPVTLEQLGALCEEMAAVVRAGVPLEQGLAQAADDLPGAIGRMSNDLAVRLERGEDLATAMRESGRSFPPYFPALVEAGVRSGRLSVALEGMVATAARMNQLRREVILALIPTAITLLVAYSLFFVIVTSVVARIGWFTQQLGLEQDRWTGGVASLAGIPWPVKVLLPVVILAGLVVWLWVSGQSGASQADRAKRLFWWLPPARRILDRSRLCSFCEVLALLIEQQVPAGEAVRLAAAASGDGQLREAGDALAGAIERGETSAASSKLPPTLRWFLLGSAAAPGKTSRAMANGLQRMAESYRHEVLSKTELLRVYLPAAATVFVGGTFCLIYGLVALWPWWKLLYQFGEFPMRTM